ncbi:rCG25155 [Rattus norvegicus]|uniref:RCG25155 n=1 Tax=Rattus norvegicus TaxID=10116 RepID=A6I1Z3_RAT|nr:rCG25155 [Rattus norvegicus]
MWRKRNTPPLMVGLQTGTTSLEISLTVPQKIEIALPEDPAIPLLGVCPKDAPSYLMLH